MTGKALKAIISLHDVMPETLPQVKDVLERLKAFGIPPVTLYVVPGRDWQNDDLDWLRQCSDAGYELAAHGWLHQTEPRRLYHRLHAALISRNVAEHLALDKEEIFPFIQRSMAWFPDNGLPLPALYVPPAWALGTRSQVFGPGQAATGAEAPTPLPQGLTPFPRFVEVLKGYIDVISGALHKMPLVGYEVDTLHRKHFVRYWNTVNLRKARRMGLPLRIGIHPNDFDLLLSRDLVDLLQSSNLTPLDLASSLAT